jgi:hypothetical protein
MPPEPESEAVEVPLPDVSRFSPSKVTSDSIFSRSRKKSRERLRATYTTSAQTQKAFERITLLGDRRQTRVIWVTIIDVDRSITGVKNVNEAGIIHVNVERVQKPLCLRDGGPPAKVRTGLSLEQEAEMRETFRSLAPELNRLHEQEGEALINRYIRYRTAMEVEVKSQGKASEQRDDKSSDGL